MKLLVTGGTGFVMSHVIQQWVARGPEFEAVCVDVMAPDELFRDFVAPHQPQIEIVEGSVSDPDLWSAALENHEPDYFIHGAAMTPNRGTSERTQAKTIVDVNIQGVLLALEWARTQPSLRRIVHVSTGSVYGSDASGGLVGLHNSSAELTLSGTLSYGDIGLDESNGSTTAVAAGLVGINNASLTIENSVSFSELNASCCAWPQTNLTFSFVNSCRGYAKSDRLWINLL